MKKTSRPNIDTHDHFVQEFRSLLDDINENIRELAQYERVEMKKPSVEIVEKLNRLKVHRKKLTDALKLYGDISEDQYAEIRPEARKIYGAAWGEYLQASDELTSS